MVAFRALGILCFFAATCALYAALTLSWPGTALDALWAVNPTGHAGLLPLGRLAGLGFLLLAMAALLCGWGWLGRRRFAWYGVVAGLAINLLGDAGQIALGRWREGLVGVVAAGLVLAYLTRRSTRERFR